MPHDSRCALACGRECSLRSYIPPEAGRVTGLRPALIGLGLLGLLLTAFGISLSLGDEETAYPGLEAAVTASVMVAYIGSGLIAWGRRPHNHVGALLCGVGFTYFLNALKVSDVTWVFTVGCLGGAVFFIVFIQLVLAYPSGQVTLPIERRLLGVGYGLAIGIPLGLAFFTSDLADWQEDSPPNPLMIVEQQGIADAIDAVGSLIGAVVVAALVVLIVRRWRRATPAARRVLTPVLACGAVMLVMFALLLAADGLGGGESTFQEVGNVIAVVPFLLLPFVFLGGLLRSRWARASAVEDLVERLGGEREPLRAAVAEAVGDPTIELAYWLDAERRFVSDEGHALALPAADDPARGVVEVRHGEELVGAILFDRSRDEERELVASAAAAAALAMENGRLEAELRARVEDLRDSRARIVTAGLAERRRLERDLHDGAQQRLVSLSLQLGLARNAIDEDPDGARVLLDRAGGELSDALEELRELARGIHPAILTDRGLPAAVDALAARSPTPVDVEEMPQERLPTAVEAAAYFVVSEALANLAKHAAADHATVRVARENGHAVVEVRDDGRGGANAEGHGLRGLADRVDALDGHLDVESPPGAGTTIRAEIPCASS
ncbi:MAG: sensor histidine kinase [Solirubrobacteraceae bacterium]|nr:sensor histidine kinase [Solirubrobacteraceae bacterium]